MKQLNARGLLTVVITAQLVILSTLKVIAQDTTDRSRVVSVTGEGKVTAPPDVATIHFNIVTRDADPENARSANAEASRKAINTIRDLGVQEDKIRLDQLSLNPVREWDPEQRRNIEAGFEINRGLSVELDDLDLVPTVVARVIQSGANRIRSVGYGLSNDQEARAHALSKAVENARFKATTMLGALNESIGKVLEIREESVRIPGPVMRGYAVAAMEKTADPNPEAYAPGLIEITAQVVVTFEIQ